MNFNRIKEAEAQHYMPVFARDNIAFDRGEGNYLYDTAGKKYLDFTAGGAVNTVGYGNPQLTEAITMQAEKLPHVSNRYYTEVQSRYVKRLCETSGFSRVFLCSSGEEATICAIKLAQKVFKTHGAKKTVLAAEGILPDGFGTFKYNDFDDFKQKMKDDVGAVIIETVQSERGVRPFGNDFLVNAYVLCKSKGVLFIVDETQTGMGRTGRLFSFEHFGLQPDIIIAGGGIAGGFPMGACLATEEAGTAFETGDFGSVFGGNALSCAAADKILEMLDGGGLLKTSAEVGEYFGNALAHFSKYDFIVDIRGLGLMRGIQLSEKIPAHTFETALRDRGFLVNAVGNNTVRLTPPLTITPAEIDSFIAALDELCASTCVM